MRPEMRIFDALCGYVPEDAIIQDVSVGIFWTFVQTQYGSALSASAHRWCPDPPGAIIPYAGSLIGMPVHSIAELYLSESLTARALANAAVSASFPACQMTGTVFPGKAQTLLESLCAEKTRHIALIGHFHFADELRALGHHLDIYELDGRCEDGDIPSSLIPQYLPNADIVVMTSSTMLTHATEQILDACSPDAFKMIVGPTIPLHPLLWDYGFDAVCGSIITDNAQVSATARQGGNHKQLTGSEKLNFIRPGTMGDPVWSPQGIHLPREQKHDM